MFETDRLSIRKYNTDDALCLFEILNEKDVTKFIPESTISFDEALDAVTWLISNYEKPISEYFKYSFAITLKDSGKYIGWCGFGTLDFDINKVEVYYTISRKYWGYGYASETVKALINYIFMNYNIYKLVALVKRDNIASHKIIDKNGFKLIKVVEGLSSDYEFYDGELYYELECPERLK